MYRKRNKQFVLDSNLLTKEKKTFEQLSRFYPWSIVGFDSILPVTVKFHDVHVIEFNEFVENLANFSLKENIFDRWRWFIEF